MRNGLRLIGVSFLALAGCQMTNKPDDLALGRTAIEQRNFDESTKRLDAYLTKNPNGPKTAEAFYLKGQALQKMPNEDTSDAQGRWQQARLAYVEALKVGTDNAGLEGLIRASLADVAFYQEDYATAAQQGTAAYRLLEDADVRAKSLYCSGLSLQRLGRFADGDRTLDMVIKYHPGTEQAAKAKQRLGAKAFVVSIPGDSPAAARTTAATVAKQGFTPTPMSDASVSVGPYQTYAQAKAARSRLNQQYPRATIVP